MAAHRVFSNRDKNIIFIACAVIEQHGTNICVGKLPFVTKANEAKIILTPKRRISGMHFDLIQKAVNSSRFNAVLNLKKLEYLLCCIKQQQEYPTHMFPPLWFEFWYRRWLSMMQDGKACLICNTFLDALLSPIAIWGWGIEHRWIDATVASAHQAPASVIFVEKHAHSITKPPKRISDDFHLCVGTVRISSCRIHAGTRAYYCSRRQFH
mmetsp:Transcript_14068/g.30174  ORF Transcript_14068/g.30174 Transcript_14068/m.30174 type:complete len:210 (-) Transcript_14068:649-1278(-)